MAKPIRVGVINVGGYAGAELARILARHPGVDVVADPPATKQTWGSNYCLICPKLSPQTGRLVVTSAIDNLVKGAAGQAVQNMNLMTDQDETLGLEALPLYP